MLRLDLSSEPVWLDLPAGVRLLLLPLTTSIMAAARSDPAVAKLGDGASQDVIAIELAKAIARVAVLDWDGVGDSQGNPVPVSADGISALLDLYPMFEAFQTRYVAKGLLLVDEGNGSAPAPSGSSAGARNTAQPARASAKTARRGKMSR